MRKKLPPHLWTSGQLARNRADMVAGNPWGELEAIRPAATSPYWHFRCAKGHEVTRDGCNVRSAKKAGHSIRCPECVRLAKEAKAESVAAE